MQQSNSDTNALGRDLTALTVGIDRFQRQAGEDTLLGGEGLVPIFIGQDLVDAERIESWEQARTELADLIARADALPDSPRARFLRAMARSVRAAVRLFSGEPISYREKLTDLVSVDAGPVADDIIDELRDSVLTTIAYYGYRSGTPVERVAKWESERAVPAENIPAVFDELMAEAKRRTDATIFDTGDYTMRLRPLRNAHYTARCAFDEGFMDINLDVSFTRPALKHLVCHEVFPGHSTQLLSTRAGVVAGTSPPDALLCTTNGATGSVQEGIGDQGIELLDWVDDDHDSAHIELRRLQTAAGTNAAYHLAESGWTMEQSEAYLRNVAFGHPEWARGRTIQAKHPFRGPFLASYWFGNEAVRAARLRTSKAHRKVFIDYLYGQVNTPESLTMFAATTA
jgi:hypothetical protein